MRTLGRAHVPLSQSVQQCLNKYAIAASAAGVSLLTFAQYCEAKVVYTAKHHVIGHLGSYGLDLNNDGIVDVTIFENSHATSEGGQIARLNAAAASNNVVKGYPWFTSVGSGLKWASALRPRQKIGGGGTRFGYAVAETMAAAATVAGNPAYSFAAWGNLPLIPYRYLGVKFQINGKTHYGWARLIAKVSGLKISATLTGYAYETVANKTIVAGDKGGSQRIDSEGLGGKTGSLGWLAQGANGRSRR